MDMDDHAPLGPDPLSQLSREDLDAMSADELEARIAALEAEVARARAQIGRAAAGRQGAEALFRR